MENFNIRDYFLKDRPGEELGQRGEAIITQGLALMVTLLAIAALQTPLALTTSAITNLVALFVFIQAVRGKFGYLILFPMVTAISICIAAIAEGRGSHDLVWVGVVGLFLLAHVHSRKSNFTPILLGTFMLVLFSGTALAEMNGILPNPYGTDLEHLLLGVLYLSSIMGAMTAVFHRHRRLLGSSLESRAAAIQAQNELKILNNTLENQVRERTEQLEESNRNLLAKTARLQAASEISQELTNNIKNSTNNLLHSAARLISEKLGYYHVGIFLVDSPRGFAVLHAANSKGGQQMLERHHQLKVGGTGIVGYVSQSGRLRIASNTGADAVFFNNPFLPETRSEIALPIKLVNSVIGVLDVQSTQSAAFSDEDASILMTIANQLAVLLSRSEDTETSRQSGRLIVPLGAKELQIGYSFRPDGSIVSFSKSEINPSLEKSLAMGEIVSVSSPGKGVAPSLAVPVKYREQVIGLIQIESDDTGRTWTEDEIQLVQAIADRAALALENARLFEDATRRAHQEETILHVTTQIGASTDFERIMQTTIQELGLALGASRSFIQIGDSMNADEKEAQ
ncbi:MAG: GAF domain-containing protein [Chloroflexi bacterium]|nr:GAF domain-containing protein [Chloroflexota bacterium]